MTEQVPAPQISDEIRRAFTEARVAAERSGQHGETEALAAVYPLIAAEIQRTCGVTGEVPLMLSEHREAVVVRCNREPGHGGTVHQGTAAGYDDRMIVTWPMDEPASRDPRVEQWLIARMGDVEVGDLSAREVMGELLSEYRLWADATYGPAS